MMNMTNYRILIVRYSENENDDLDRDNHNSKTCKNCVICCYNVLMVYNLFSNAYPTLTIGYQFLLTLPVTQVICERSFSTLKYFKNRLRNMTNEHLEWNLRCYLNYYYKY